MVCLQGLVAPLLLVALAAQAFPLNPAALEDRSLAGLFADGAEDGAKFFAKDGSKAVPTIGKDLSKAAPTAAKDASKVAPAAVEAVPAAAKAAPEAAKAAPATAANAAPAKAASVATTDAEDAAACLLRARTDDAAAACGSNKGGKPSDEEIKQQQALAASKTPEDKAAEKAAKAKAKAEAKAQKQAAAKAKADHHNAKANSKKALVKSPSNKDDIPAETKCGSSEGVNTHSQADVLAAQTRGVQLAQSGLNVGGFPHEFTSTKGEGLDDVNLPAACKGQKVFEFPILPQKPGTDPNKSGNIFDVGNDDAGTDRVLFTRDEDGTNINCGLITHSTKTKKLNAAGEKVLPFVDCK